MDEEQLDSAADAASSTENHAAPESSATPPAAADAVTPEILKSAYNAFKKRWKLTRLDQESRIGRGPMSGGQKSAIDGIIPPKDFSAEVWESLAEKGRIKYTGNGFYAMP
jgi:hypothetical protein